MKDERASQLISCFGFKQFVGVVREVRFEKRSKYKHKFRVVVLLLLSGLFTYCPFPNFDDHLWNKVHAEKKNVNYTSTLRCPKLHGSGSGKGVRWLSEQQHSQKHTMHTKNNQETTVKTVTTHVTYLNCPAATLDVCPHHGKFGSALRTRRQSLTAKQGGLG